MCHTSLSQEDDIAGSGRMVCVCVCVVKGLESLHFFLLAGISDVVEFFRSSSVEVFSAADVCQGIIALRRKKLPCAREFSFGVSKQRPVSQPLSNGSMCLAAAPRSLARKPLETRTSEVATPDTSAATSQYFSTLLFRSSTCLSQETLVVIRPGEVALRK